MMNKKTSSKMTLEEKIAKLESIELKFQEPDLNLEDAIEQHKQAIEIAQQIKLYLEEVESSLKKIDIAALLNNKNDEIDEQ